MMFMVADRYVVDNTDPDHDLGVRLTVVSTGVSDPAASDPEFAAPWPNPARGGTRMSFQLPHDGPVQLALYGVDGRQVRVLLDGARGSGRQEVTWDGCNS